MFVIKRAVLTVQADWDKTDEPEKTQGEEDEEGEVAEKEEQPEDNGNDGPKEYSDDELDSHQRPHRLSHTYVMGVTAPRSL